jgi:hypothetical protein
MQAIRSLDADDSIDVNRPITLRQQVDVSGDLTASGGVVLVDAIWPDEVGAAGRVLQVQSGSQLHWAEPGTGSAAYTRVVVTTTPFAVSKSQTLVLIDRPDAVTELVLPAVADAGSCYYVVKDVGRSFAAGEYIELQPDGVETIEGDSSFRIYGPSNAVTLAHDGVSDWALV